MDKLVVRYRPDLDPVLKQLSFRVPPRTKVGEWGEKAMEWHGLFARDLTPSFPICHLHFPRWAWWAAPTAAWW